jgi:hypothetical protein
MFPVEGRSDILTLLLLMLMVVGAACTPLEGDRLEDLSGHGPPYQTAIAEVLTPNAENGSVEVFGQVKDVEPSCSDPDAGCGFTLLVNEIYIRVIRDCPGQGADLDLKGLQRGEQVTVHGRYAALGTIDLCGSDDFFVRESR